MKSLSRYWLQAILILAISVWVMVFAYPDPKFSLNFLDVGQGNAVLITTPGDRRILIDGGPDQTVTRKLSEYIPFWDKHLDLVIATHLHADHIGGLIPVLREYTVEKVYLNNQNYSSPVTEKLYSTLKVEYSEVESLGYGDEIRVGELRLKQLNRTGQEQWESQQDPNQSALVFKLEYQGFKALLTSDLELADQPRLPNLLDEVLSVDLLQVPHQGSKGGLSAQVLRQLNPKIAVIAVGENNRFGHPHEQTLDILKKFQIKIYRTDKNGDIQITKTVPSFKIRTEK